MSSRISMLPSLWSIADQWVAATGTSHATLGNRAILSSGVFERLSEGKTITVQNFERLLNYLADGANWPGDIPESAGRQLSGFVHIAIDPAASSHKADECMSDSDLGAAA